MTTTNPLALRSLVWRTLQLYGRHFPLLFLIGGLPRLLYILLLSALGHSLSSKPALGAMEILSPAQISLLFWNLPNLLLLGPLVSGALVAACVQLQGQQSLRPGPILKSALRAWPRLLGAHLLLWLLNGAVILTLLWLFGRSDPPAWHSLGGLAMIGIVLAFLGYWWVRWSFLTQAVIMEGCTPTAAFGHSSRLVAGAWWRTLILFLLLSGLPGLLDNLLSLVGSWAVSVSHSLTVPLGTLGLTLFYCELRRRGEGERPVPVPGEAAGV